MAIGLHGSLSWGYPLRWHSEDRHTGWGGPALRSSVAMGGGRRNISGVSLELEGKQLQRSGSLESLGWQTTAGWIPLHHRGTLCCFTKQGAGRHLRALLSLSAADINLERMRWGQAEVNINELKHWAQAFFKYLFFLKLYLNSFILMVLENEVPSLFYKWLSQLVCFPNRTHIK